jgi:hypothetical protein
MSVESLTYADLADRLGTTLEAARSLVRRLRLPRQTGNDGKVRINVDFAEIQYRPLPARSPGGGASSCQSVFPHPAQASTIPASCCFSSRGNNEREAMKLILSTRPLLNAHFERWSKRVMEALGRRGAERVGDVFVEEYLRELWERSCASS